MWWEPQTPDEVETVGSVSRLVEAFYAEELPVFKKGVWAVGSTTHNSHRVPLIGISMASASPGLNPERSEETKLPGLEDLPRDISEQLQGAGANANSRILVGEGPRELAASVPGDLPLFWERN